MGKSIKALRAEVMLSQDELAAKAGVSKKTIVDLENGNVTRPQWRTVRALSKALGVKPASVEEFDTVMSGNGSKIAA